MSTVYTKLAHRVINTVHIYIGTGWSLRDDYKYETHIQISIFDVKVKLY